MGRDLNASTPQTWLKNISSDNKGTSAQFMYKMTETGLRVKSAKFLAHCTLTVVIVTVFMYGCEGQMSGYYYDNGYDQTVLHTSLDISEQELMQQEILHLLGLNNRPQGSSRRRTITSANSTVPTFMRDIYESLLTEGGEQGELKNLTFQNLDSLHNSQFQLQDKDLRQ